MEIVGRASCLVTAHPGPARARRAISPVGVRVREQTSSPSEAANSPTAERRHLDASIERLRAEEVVAPVHDQAVEPRGDLAVALEPDEHVRFDGRKGHPIGVSDPDDRVDGKWRLWRKGIDAATEGRSNRLDTALIDKPPDGPQGGIEVERLDVRLQLLELEPVDDVEHWLKTPRNGSRYPPLQALFT
jgi:hypothetical protein